MKIIFDCDGVIFDSNRLKSDAFRATLRVDYPDALVEDFVRYHEATGGVSRFVKFRHFLADMANEKPSEARVAELLERFSAQCRSLYQEASFTEGAEEAIISLAQDHTLFVASGSAEDELRDVFAQRGIAKYFEAVFGSPTPKPELVARIVDAANSSKQAVMIGDAVKDVEAAQASGISVIVMTRYSDAPADVQALATQLGLPKIDSLRDVRGLLDTL